MTDRKIIIGGGGISGLTIGLFLNAKVLEKEVFPGGLLSSYNVNIMNGKKEFARQRKQYCAFFDRSGHWAWGLQQSKYAYSILSKYSRFRKITRKSSVYLVDYEIFVPYPIQYHIAHLPKSIKDKALEDLITARKNINEKILNNCTFDKALRLFFGSTLYEIFFRPYNEMYTDGLMYHVAPPRKIKIPNDIDIIMKSAKEKNYYNELGYNATFFYPLIGWGPLLFTLSKYVKFLNNSTITYIDLKKKKITINDITDIEYDYLISSIPLNKLIKIIDKEYINVDLSKSDPYTSVLIINAVVKPGELKHSYHWIYLSKTKLGFHRIGYYTNVSRWFLPNYLRKTDTMMIYIEKIFRPSNIPNNLESVVIQILDEAQELGLIGEPIYYDYEIVDVAYTWRYPNSSWANDLINELIKYQIIPIGRYGTWGEVEGIVETIDYNINNVLKKKNKVQMNFYIF